MTFFGLLTESWIDGDQARDCAQHLNIVMNDQGFVESPQDAARCAEFISGMPDKGPGLWLPWLLTVYSSSA